MHYLQEWCDSGVDEALTKLNVVALSGYNPFEHLLYAGAIPRRNDGRLTDQMLKRYAHTEHGGWWCSGIDLLTGREDLWGCFKPLRPRRQKDRDKLIKYEHPPMVGTGLFALRVPLHLWQKIADRHGLPFDPHLWQTDRPDGGFWQWVIDHPEVPLVLTEGAKKAGALLTAGFAAIALPGINGAYRSPKDAWGNRLGRSHLLPQLMPVVGGGRLIYLAFDQDEKPKTQRAVQRALQQTAYLLAAEGCGVKVVQWPSNWGKGVDDLLQRRGLATFEALVNEAWDWDLWKVQTLYRLTYSPQVTLQQRYLGEIEVPEASALVAICSPKGTGKSYALGQMVAEARRREQKVLVIGHRIRLVEELCQRFGLPYLHDAQGAATTGYGLCIDSLHPQSQAKFHPQAWSGALVILDEVEQVLWHGLNASTCREQRVAILRSLKALIQHVWATGGRVVLSDADLSDLSLDYLLSFRETAIVPWVVLNQWQPNDQEAWPVYHYDDSTPKKLVRALEQELQRGGRSLVFLSGQKTRSAWGTSTLECYFQQRFPEVRILRLDAESLGDPSHPAYGCMSRLDEVLANYDLVLASPALETGVSLELRGHFSSVWCIAQGVQTVTSVAQALARLREPVPRHLWIAPYGFNQVGNGATSLAELLRTTQKMVQLNIQLLQRLDAEAWQELETDFQAESLACWGKMAIRVNGGMRHYRRSLLALLAREGHTLRAPVKAKLPSKRQETEEELLSPPVEPSLDRVITEIRDRNYQGECEAVVRVQSPQEKEYQSLQKRLAKSPQDRHRLRKYELEKRYGLPVTADLVQRDDRGWYAQLRLHYYLTLGRSFLADRDARMAKTLLHQGNGEVFLPDFCQSQLGAVVGILERLGLCTLLQQSDRELSNRDEDLIALAQIALANRTAMKTALGIGLGANASPITVLRRLLEKIGYGLTCLRVTSHDKKRLRIYRVKTATDGREQVFQNWLQSDRQRPGSSAFWQQETHGMVLSTVPSPPLVGMDGGAMVQLSLDLEGKEASA